MLNEMSIIGTANTHGNSNVTKDNVWLEKSLTLKKDTNHHSRWKEQYKVRDLQTLKGMIQCQ